MQALWGERSKWSLMLLVELAYIKAKAQLAYLPMSLYEQFRKHSKFTLKRIDEIENGPEGTGHDVLAFVKTVQESLRKAGVERDGEFHKGLSSYNAQDPANMLRLRKANGLIIEALYKLYNSLKSMSLKHKWTLMLAYTHVQDAEPTTFGHLLANYAFQIRQRIHKLERIMEEDLCWGNMGGTVGTYAGIDIKVAELALSELGLKPRIDTQIISRDNHAEFMCELAIIAGVIEEMARTFHIRMHSAIHELEEPKKKGYRGSSAMSHKRNPNLTEQLFGLARLIRAAAMAALENIETLDYRDIAQSIVERHIFPDATSLVHHAVTKMTKLVEGLVVCTDRMKERVEVDSLGVWATQQVRIALMDAGVSYDEAYLYTQACAFQAVSEKRHILDVMCVKEVSETNKNTADGVLGVDKLKSCFDAKSYIESGIEYSFTKAFPELTEISAAV